MSGNTLHDSSNEIQIQAVTWPGASDTDQFDNFQLKDMMCFFHQKGA